MKTLAVVKEMCEKRRNFEEVSQQELGMLDSKGEVQRCWDATYKTPFPIITRDEEIPG